jgi:hypothetical protein
MHDADHQTTDGPTTGPPTASSSDTAPCRLTAASLDGCVAGSEHAMDRMTGLSHRPSLSDDHIAGTVDDVTISWPVFEEAVAVVLQAAASATARYCGPDKRLHTTSGRSHPC